MSLPTGKKSANGQNGTPSISWYSIPPKQRSWSSASGARKRRLFLIHWRRHSGEGVSLQIPWHTHLDLTWTFKTTSLVKKEQNRLYFQANLSKQLLVSFYSALWKASSPRASWCRMPAALRLTRRLYRESSNQHREITNTQLPSPKDIYRTQCPHLAANIIKDSSHHGHHLITLISFWRRHRSIKARTSSRQDCGSGLQTGLLKKTIKQLQLIQNAGPGKQSTLLQVCYLWTGVQLFTE